MVKDRKAYPMTLHNVNGGYELACLRKRLCRLIHINSSSCVEEPKMKDPKLRASLRG